MKGNKKNVKQFFHINFIYIEGLTVAGLAIIGGIISIVVHFVENRADDQYLIAGIVLIVLGILILVFRKKIKDFMV